jgi:hypothetical protein
MAQQTALTWFWEQLPELLPFTVDTETAVGLLMAYEQAKAMEKMRMIDFALKMLEVDCSKTGTDILHDEAEEYYNQTYQSNQD